KNEVYSGEELRPEIRFHAGNMEEFREDRRIYNDPIALTKKHVKAYEAQLDEQFAEESRCMAWDGDVYEDDSAVDISEENEKEAVE
ncbi:hypothetical protein D7Z54_33775, partial [Salibacterium salarium]